MSLSILFLYLIGFQLIPLRQTFRKSVYFRLYPDTDTDKLKTIQKLLQLLLAISALIFSLAAVSSGWTAMMTLLVVNSAFIWLFIYGYLPRRLSK
ncbi:MAG: ABC transporter permease [Alkalibacterium sp.]|nr:ABC transporter permease [Alkalibacterium sp.]